MKRFAERLCLALSERDMTAAELSRILGINEGTISQYKKGLYEPKQKRTQAIAEALHVSVDWLMVADVPMDKTERNLAPLSTHDIYLRPVYDSAAAGFNVLAQDTIIGYMPTYISVPSEREQYVWITVVGDSMSPMIDDGSKILVRRQESVDSGQIAVVLIDGEEAVVKRVVYDKEWIELQSINPYYPPRRFEGKEVERIRVFGLVKEVSKKLA